MNSSHSTKTSGGWSFKSHRINLYTNYTFTFSLGLQESDYQLDCDLFSALRYHEQPINQQQHDKLTELFSL